MIRPDLEAIRAKWKRNVVDGNDVPALLAYIDKLERERDEVRALLDANGGDCNCDCDCDHADENHEPDCVRCLSWRISWAIEKP